MKHKRRESVIKAAVRVVIALPYKDLVMRWPDDD
jgi:hypothetical protein